MLPVATPVQRSAPKINACVLCVRVLKKGHLYEVFLVLTKTRPILDEMCRLYGKFASYLRRVLCKTRLISPRINGPNVYFEIAWPILAVYCFMCCLWIKPLKLFLDW